MMQRCSETLAAPSPDSIQRLLLVSSTAMLRSRCETLQSAWLTHSQSLHTAESAMRRSPWPWQLMDCRGRCPAHGDSDKPKHAVAVSRCPYSHICVGTCNIERVINYVEPCLLPSRMRVSPPARPGHAICVVPLQCDRSRNTGSPVMPACGRRRHGANPQSICESECPQKRPRLSRLQRRANYPERRDE